VYALKKNCLKNAVTVTRKLLSDSVFGVTPVFGDCIHLLKMCSIEGGTSMTRVSVKYFAIKYTAKPALA
jgi:hypothetical protein